MAEYSLRVKIGAELREFTRKMQRFKGELRDVSKSAREVGSAMTQRLTLPIAAAAGAALTSAAKFERLRNGLVAVTGDAEEAGREFERLREVAQRPGLTFEQAVRGSVRLQSVGFSADLARQALSEFGNALAIAGGEADDLNGVALALTQIASKGQVMAEELRQIQERVPQITQAMQDAFGTAQSEEIQSMGLSAEEFVRGVVEALGELERAEGGLANAFVNLRQSVTNSLARIGDVINEQLNVQGFVERLAGFIERLAEGFANLSPRVQRFALVVTGLVAVAGPAVFLLGAFSAAIAAISAPVALAAGALIGLTAVIVDLALNWRKRLNQMKQAINVWTIDLLSKVSIISKALSMLVGGPIQPVLAQQFEGLATFSAKAVADLAGETNQLREELDQLEQDPADRMVQGFQEMVELTQDISDNVRNTRDDINETARRIDGLDQVGFFQEQQNRRFLQGTGRPNLMDQFWQQMTLTSVFGAARGASAPSPLEKIQQQLRRESAFGLIASDAERAQREASLLRETLRKFSQDPDIDPESMGVRELIRALQEAEEEASRTAGTIQQLGTRAISQFSRGVGQIVGGLFGGGRGQEQLRLRRFQLQEQLRMLQSNLRRREISQREYALRVGAIQQQLHQTERDLARETASVVEQTFRSLADVVQNVVEGIIQDITRALATAALLYAIPGLGGGAGFGALFRNALGVGGGFGGGGGGVVVPGGPTMAARLPLDIQADMIPSGAIVVSAKQGSNQAQRRGQQGLQ